MNRFTPMTLSANVGLTSCQLVQFINEITLILRPREFVSLFGHEPAHSVPFKIDMLNELGYVV